MTRRQLQRISLTSSCSLSHTFSAHIDIERLKRMKFSPMFIVNKRPEFHIEVIQKSLFVTPELAWEWSCFEVFSSIKVIQWELWVHPWVHSKQELIIANPPYFHMVPNWCQHVKKLRLFKEFNLVQQVNSATQSHHLPRQTQTNTFAMSNSAVCHFLLPKMLVEISICNDCEDVGIVSPLM